MSTRILEVSSNKRHLSLERGFIQISSGSEELGKIPVDQILAVIGAAHGLSYSQNLLSKLAELNIPLVICNSAFSPTAVLWPLDGHFNQSARIDAQLNASTPFKKQLWKQLIQQKIQQQAQTLDAKGIDAQALYSMSTRVKSGDSDNLEAQAAKRYWPLLMGHDFQRERHGQAPNNLLNYGYTIVRSATARAVVAAGLHPSIGVFHRNRNNPFRLVDDLMEPFRPFVDLLVWQMYKRQKQTELTPENKNRLVSLLSIELESNTFATSLLNHIQNLCTSVSKSFIDKKLNLALPNPTLMSLKTIVTEQE